MNGPQSDDALESSNSKWMRNPILKKCYLLVAEPHLPPRVSRDIHAAQKDPLLVTIVQDGRTRFGLQASHQFRLDWGVILFVDNIIDAVTVNQQVFLQQTHSMSQKKQTSLGNGLKASKAFIQQRDK